MTTANTYARPYSRNDDSPLAQWWWTVDKGLLAAISALIALGVALSFASSPAAIRVNESISDPFHYAWRMVAFAAAGMALMLMTSLLSPRNVRRLAVLALLGSIGLMMLLPFIGAEVKGAERWISIGPFGLQPSEFAKPALIVFAAWMFAETQKGQGVPGVSIAFLAYGLTAALIVIQPDVGQTLLLTTVFITVFFLAGVPFRWMAVLGGLFLAGLAALYAMFDHVRSRVDVFRGGGPDASGPTQIDMASEAIAAGGLLGRGAGEGVMKRSVPDLHTDFIYAVGAEEFGLIFSLILIGLYAFIVMRGLSRAMKLTDPYQQTAAAGLFMLLGLQACINIAVNLALIPTKGMTLPFISYGGSSMLAMGLTMGLALALTRRSPGAYEPGALLPRARGRILPR